MKARLAQMEAEANKLREQQVGSSPIDVWAPVLLSECCYFHLPAFMNCLSMSSTIEFWKCFLGASTAVFHGMQDLRLQ